MVEQRRHTASVGAADSEDEIQLTASSNSAAFPAVTSRDQLIEWQRILHRTAPANKYFKAKIPYRTICVSFLFLVVGSFFLAWAALELSEKGFSEAYEKIILGAIMFIPGSYHSFLAF